MKQALDWCEAKAAGTLNPRQAERALRGLAEQWPKGEADLRLLLEEFPLGEESLLHLISVSSICAARLARDPGILLWLCHPDVCAAPRGRGRMSRDLRASTDGSI